MDERDARAEIREWLTGMAARWPDGMALPTAVIQAHWPLREYGMRCEPPTALPGEPLALVHVRPLDVTFYAVLDDGSEITVPTGLQAAF